jgi:hypothetical protein
MPCKPRATISSDRVGARPQNSEVMLKPMIEQRK